MQRKLDTLRDVEAQFFERNAELDRNIDVRKRTNEQLKNEFECLTDAIKNSLQAADKDSICPSDLDSILDSIANATSAAKQNEHVY